MRATALSAGFLPAPDLGLLVADPRGERRLSHVHTTPRGKNHGYSFYQRGLKTDGWFALWQGENDVGIFNPQQLANIKAAGGSVR